MTSGNVAVLLVHSDDISRWKRPAAHLGVDHGRQHFERVHDTPRWFMSGKVYALRGRAPVLCLIEGDPRVFAFFRDQRDWLGRNVLLVNMRRYVEDSISGYAKYFARVEPVS